MELPVRRIESGNHPDVRLLDDGFVQNPYVDEWIETDRFNAIVEPSRLRDQALVGDPDADPLFHVPSNSYTILTPVHVYEPLEEILREETLNGRPLGEVGFGEIRQYRSGGEVHMDVRFDGLEVTLPDRENEPITMGLTSGDDFFGGHAVYVEGFAQDTACKNSIRSLTDKEIVKHVGDVEEDDRKEWEHFFDQFGFPVARERQPVDDVDGPIQFVLEPRDDIEAELVDGRPVVPLDETIEFATEHYATFQSALDMLDGMYEDVDTDGQRSISSERS